MNQLRKYRILADVIDPAEESFSGAAGEADLAACATLLDIFDRDKSDITLEPAPESELPDGPLALGGAIDLLRGVCDNFLSWGLLLRVDLPPNQTLASAPEVSLDDSGELQAFLDQLSDMKDEQSLYPILVWGIERSHEKEIMKTIDAYLLMRRSDLSLFQRIVDLGGLRLEVFPASLSLWFSCEKLGRVRGLVQSQCSQLGVELKWLGT